MKPKIFLMYSLLLITISVSGQLNITKNLHKNIDQQSPSLKYHLEGKSFSRQPIPNRNWRKITRKNKRISSNSFQRRSFQRNSIQSRSIQRRSFQRGSIQYPRKIENKSKYLIAKKELYYISV
jgi:hypothetical protein